MTQLGDANLLGPDFRYIIFMTHISRLIVVAYSLGALCLLMWLRKLVCVINVPGKTLIHRIGGEERM